MAFHQPAPHAPEPPRKLDVFLEAVTAFQAGAATLQAGTALALREDGGRLEAVTQDGTAVGLIPADKRAVLSRGPWAGTVRSVKRQAATAAVPAAASTTPQQPADGLQPSQEQQEQQEEKQQQQPPGDGAAEEQQAAAAATAAQQPAEERQGPSQPPAAVVVQVLVRFTPEEQRWAQRQPADHLAQQMEEEDTARLSREQFEALAANEELRWMLRDERLQKVVCDIDSAPDRERALLRALQAPNFKEFADKVLTVAAPETS
ncbi:HIT-type Zinc finger family isoform 1 [Chlorella sorokiniana]|uniref:HIT-type Zinc finger family isoform 1 n=1 Tax=Chlorella sorokiniana TaxID=3076 RepID=A0A2P6TGS7_CHLSO|nr:HIT-type Zinc finger family isoform 1 [Chlorella sorokiniana]|eukprot:PRW33328.1 HIT-type Zinc finger family isoform 1 [Chlorella sorokiniana]